MLRRKSKRGSGTSRGKNLNVEALESRQMLSVNSPAFDGDQVVQADQDALQAEVIRNYLSQNVDTSYLQEGASDLRLVEIDRDADGTTTRFQQTYDGIPIHNAIISVVQDHTGSTENVFDHGYVSFNTSHLAAVSVEASEAELLAAKALLAPEYSSQVESVLYPSGSQAHLAWQVTTFVDKSQSSSLSGEYKSVVSASNGQIISQEAMGEDHFGQFDSHTGVYPRIVINNDIGPAGSRAYAAPFDAVVALALGCTGTLIAPNVVISARHCNAGGGSQIIFGDDSNNGVYTATVDFASLPDGNGSLLDGGDVSILTLTEDVPAGVATPMRLIEEGDSLEGEVAVTLGYGFNGVGSAGHGFSSDDFRWGGENIIDAYGAPSGASGSNIFSTDFDNTSGSGNTIGGSDPVPLEFEATTAPGDSGGPLLVQTNDGEWVIAAVLSGGTTSTSVYGDISWWTGVAPFRTEIEAAGGEFLGGGVGTVDLDKGTYLVEDTVNITLRDPNAVAPVEVTIVSDSGDSETITLTNSGGITYSGSITTNGAAVANQDGVLQVSLFDTIEVTYNDPDDGMGDPLVATDAADIGNVAHYLSSDIPVGIEDLQTVTSTLEITDASTIIDINVQLDISHTYDSDLDVFLIAPDGTRIELFSGVGGFANDFDNTILDDEAATDIGSGSAPFSGSFSPVGSLSVVDGTSLAGVWTLEITDNFNLDQGTLNSWCIYANAMPVTVGGDFNGDGQYNCDDINALIGGIVAGTNDPAFDLTGDGQVDLADRDAWLAEAGAANLGPGLSYQLGDANLDGVVDGADFLIWNANKFDPGAPGWCGGDFNADGIADGFDFLMWNANKFIDPFTSISTTPSTDSGVTVVAQAANITEVIVVQEAPKAFRSVDLPVARQSVLTSSSFARADETSQDEDDSAESTATDFVFASLGF